MNQEKYILIGNHLDAPKYIGGEIKAYRTLLDDRFRVEGTISRENQQREVKGIASNETIDDTIETTLILFEYPLKDGANNIVYHFETRTPKKPTSSKILDLNVYGEIKNKNVPRLEGSYTGSIFPDAVIEILDEELVKEFKELELKDFIFPEIDFDESKAVPITFTLERNN